MTNLSPARRSCALFPAALAVLLATPVAAQSVTTDDEAIVALGLRPDAHGPAGTMADHVHKSGDVMLGLSFTRETSGGAHRRGTRALSDAEVAAAGYTVKDRTMTMDMAMLHLMWAPSDRVTLMAMPMWMRMDMTMEGLPAATGGGGHSGHGGHSLMPGETHAHAVEGMGDTQFGALVSLSRRPQLSAHAGLMVSAPTGKVTRRGADGRFVHYMMQGGSGTWDLAPSFTLRGMTDGFGWGVQASYLFRAEDRNKAGFRFGDRFTATAWGSLPVASRLSLSGRLALSREGTIKGHYNGAHNHSAPPDLQGNYGGTLVQVGLGANTVIADRVRLGAEASLPLHQNLNGVQLPRKWGLSVTSSLMF
ncbi:MAG TPA: hypothetical protein PKD92_01950 [Novosphingobium sp.]|nr:hypothetical protein [Novosphingobium sp.]